MDGAWRALEKLRSEGAVGSVGLGVNEWQVCHEALKAHDFDSFLLRAEDKPVLEGYAKALVAQRDRKLSLQGHADERGGREYNLALGQKRAEAVARAMELLGVQAGQVEAVSFGEERPADPASNEAAWAKNRRVEIKDR